jgi:hypothetical protein
MLVGYRQAIARVLSVPLPFLLIFPTDHSTPRLQHHCSKQSTPYPSICHPLIKSSRIMTVVASSLRRKVLYFEAGWAALTSDGDAEAIGAGTAEKADLGNGMTC